jgi:hypothetical protein
MWDPLAGAVNGLSVIGGALLIDHAADAIGCKRVDITHQPLRRKRIK